MLLYFDREMAKSSWLSHGSRLMLGLHCRSDQLDRPVCQKFPTEAISALYTTYANATRSYPIAERALKTPTRLQPDWQPDRCSSIPISTGSLHDLFTNSSINARFLHEQYSTNSTITRSSNGKTCLFTFSRHQCVLMSPSTKRPSDYWETAWSLPFFERTYSRSARLCKVG